MSRLIVNLRQIFFDEKLTERRHRKNRRKHSEPAVAWVWPVKPEPINN
jgi:hypothetical protein